MTLTLNEAHTLYDQDRERGLAALNELFRAGRAPETPLDGRYTGGLEGLDVGSFVSHLGEVVAGAWLPWLGKRLDAATQTGDNIFKRDSFTLARIFWPGYHGYVEDTPDTYRAFEFRTYIGKGMFDTDRDVLVLNYDSPENPGKDIRRVLDEVVQLADGTYLGKAHVHLYWGEWKTVAYFSLRR